MDIYEPEGIDRLIDLDKAAAELRRTDGMTEARRKAAVAEITAAALLDIAWSLRPVGTESALALGAIEFTTVERETPEAVEATIVEGDLVTATGFDEPGEVRKLRATEGEVFAEVLFESGAEYTFRLDDLTVYREHGDTAEGDDDLEPIDEYVDPAATVDDIDADFDGDPHEAAASALDTLRANEAARKAAKKKGSKK